MTFTLQENKVAKVQNWSWIWSLKGVVYVSFIYVLSHSLIRIAASSNLSQVDAKENVYSQILLLGYSTRQPPLYNWLLWLIQEVTGPTLISFLILKYALLIATACFIYLAAKHVLQDNKWAALTAFSIVLIFQIGWNTHGMFTHTIALTCLVAATFWAFLELSEKDSWGNYLIFGLCTGLGFLTKYGFGAFLLMLFVGALLQEKLRGRILSPKMVLSLFLAGLIVMPFAIWLATQSFSGAALFAKVLKANEGGYFVSALTGVAKALYLPVTFLLSLLIIIPLVFPKTISQLKSSILGESRKKTEPDYERLIFHMTIVAFLLLLGGALFAGVAGYKERYMHPLFLITTIWLMAQAQRGCTNEKQIQTFLTISLAIALVIIPLRLGYLVIGKPFCRECRQMIPYEPLAKALKARGFKQGTIISGRGNIGGNLRQFMPDARIVNFRAPSFQPPDLVAKDEQQIAVVWDVKLDGNSIPANAQQELKRRGVQIQSPPQILKVPWTHLWKETGYRHTNWGILVVQAGK